MKKIPEPFGSGILSNFRGETVFQSHDAVESVGIFGVFAIISVAHELEFVAHGGVGERRLNGGDTGIMKALAKRLNGDTSDTSICTIDETCANHMIAFAAEESRVTGKVIDLSEYEAAHSV